MISVAEKEYRDPKNSVWGSRTAGVRGHAAGYDRLETDRWACAVPEGIRGTSHHHIEAFLAVAGDERYGSAWAIPAVRLHVCNSRTSSFFDGV